MIFNLEFSTKLSIKYENKDISDIEGSQNLFPMSPFSEILRGCEPLKQKIKKKWDPGTSIQSRKVAKVNTRMVSL